MTPLDQHQDEIQKNLGAWRQKPLLQKIYGQFYQRILSLIDPQLPGLVVEIGSGIGNLKAHYPRAICTDLFPNPWLDLVCDGYELPFAAGGVSHLVLFDVFHHLRAPKAFLSEARRVLSASLVSINSANRCSSAALRGPRLVPLSVEFCLTCR